MSPIEARFYQKLDEGKVKCLLCPHGCVIAPGRSGICRVRENRDGILYASTYGLVSSVALDPIEKKPLFHVDPGSYLLSIGSYGCNFSCEFCQNWQISQERPELYEATPEKIVDMALDQKDRRPNVTGIAYTYNEPTIWMEFVLDCAKLAKRQGLRNVLVTNGFISRDALEEALLYVDALNIDVKAWTEGFYRDIVHGRLSPVMETVERAKEKAWVEVTYLVVPGENDRDEDVRGLSQWLARLDPAIPLHLSRYFPAYRFRRPATPIETLERLRKVALERLHYVYIGNAWKKGYADTVCPECKTVLLERGGLELERSHLSDASCPTCGRRLEMVGRVWAG